MKTKNAFAMSILCAAAIGFAGPAVADSCGSGHAEVKTVSDTGKSAVMSKNIVETAAAAGSFGTLIAAVNAADLAEVLQGDGPFTVFAPTDAAFAKLPKGTVEDLLKPENKAKLQAILTYHVVAGKVTSSEVVKLKKATTIQGQSIAVVVDDAGVRVDNAMVTAVDIEASNGVIHVIDNVILPKL